MAETLYNETFAAMATRFVDECVAAGADMTATENTSSDGTTIKIFVFQVNNSTIVATLEGDDVYTIDHKDANGRIVTSVGNGFAPNSAEQDFAFFKHNLLQSVPIQAASLNIDTAVATPQKRGCAFGQVLLYNCIIA